MINDNPKQKKKKKCQFRVKLLKEEIDIKLSLQGAEAAKQNEKWSKASEF